MVLASFFGFFRDGFGDCFGDGRALAFAVAAAPRVDKAKSAVLARPRHSCTALDVLGVSSVLEARSSFTGLVGFDFAAVGGIFSGSFVGLHRLRAARCLLTLSLAFVLDDGFLHSPARFLMFLSTLQNWLALDTGIQLAP